MIKLRSVSSPHIIFVLLFVLIFGVEGGFFFIVVYTESAPVTLDIHQQALKAGFHYCITIIITISTSTCVSKWKLGRHKHKHKHKQKKNGHCKVRSSCVCADAYVVVLASENWVDISTSISTRPWTNHRWLWPRPHANISKVIWRMLRPSSCLSSDWGELVSRIESNIPFCVCVCPYAYAYAPVKTRLKSCTGPWAYSL